MEQNLLVGNGIIKGVKAGGEPDKPGRADSVSLSYELDGDTYSSPSTCLIILETLPPDYKINFRMRKFG